MLNTALAYIILGAYFTSFFIYVRVVYTLKKNLSIEMSSFLHIQFPSNQGANF